MMKVIVSYSPIQQLHSPFGVAEMHPGNNSTPSCNVFDRLDLRKEPEEDFDIRTTNFGAAEVFPAENNRTGKKKVSK